MFGKEGKERNKFQASVALHHEGHGMLLVWEGYGNAQFGLLNLLIKSINFLKTIILPHKENY